MTSSRTGNAARVFLALVVFFGITTSLVRGAEEKLRIVVIKSASVPAYSNTLVGVRAYLYMRGVDFDIYEYDVGGKTREEVLEDIKASALHHPAFYLTLGTLAARLIQDCATDVPVIFAMVQDPLKNLVNASGVSLDIDPAMKLGALARILPSLKRIGIVYSEHSIPERDKVAAWCAQEGILLVERKIREVREFPDSFKDIAQGLDCFLMLADHSIYFPSSVEFLLKESLLRKVPVVGLSSIYTRAGALVSFDCDYRDMGMQTAELALGIYEKKTKTTVEAPRKVNFSLNLKVARMMGIDLSKEVLREAQEVFGQ